MPRIFSGFPYTPSLNGHLLAIKSLQQKSSPEAILTILIEAWFILPVVALPQLLHSSKEVGSAPNSRKPNLLPARLSHHKEYVTCMLEGVKRECMRACVCASVCMCECVCVCVRVPTMCAGEGRAD